MQDDGGWRLAPAYDLTFSDGPGGEHYLDIDGEGRNPTRAHVKKLGRTHGFGAARIDAIIDEVADAVSKWQGFAEAAQVEASLTHVAESIAAIHAAFG
jgi:serine/threonine-protein kinase HipA